jgi:tetratricopeptide (TPR) repeat protein
MKTLNSLLSGIFLSLALPFALTAQNVTTPRTSPQAKVKQTIGLTTITVEYSRPQVIRNGNDRTGQIWGTLVPYGYQQIQFAGGGEIPWRAGADENTVISFSDDVKVEGQDLAAGSYGLHMALEENGDVTVIFSENTSSWGSFWYDQEEDALRVKVKSEEAPFTNVLTYDFTDLGSDYCVLALTWEKKRIPFRIDVDVKEQVVQSFRDELRGITGFGWQGFLTAANYCAQNNFNHDEALQWVDIAISRNKAFGSLNVKSQLLTQMGKASEAAAVADEAAELANVNQLNALGYQMLTSGHTDKAIHYFKLNIERNPEVANCYDSLGEGYMAKGEKEKAIDAFKKSLSLNPPQFVKDNSIANLKKLGVDYKTQ